MTSIREGANTRSKCWMATSGGYDSIQDNDTSVIRGPAIKKAGIADRHMVQIRCLLLMNSHTRRVKRKLLSYYFM